MGRLTRALSNFGRVWWYLTRKKPYGIEWPWVFKNLPRPGYCRCCGAWAWLTNETPAYSAYDGAYLCEECADENDENTRTAWVEYYAGCL